MNTEPTFERIRLGAGEANTLPILMRLTPWCQFSGMSRTGTYRAVAVGHLRAVKMGNTTMIDVEQGLKWLRSLPAADIKLDQRIAA